jgi:hypothetical protein
MAEPHLYICIYYLNAFRLRTYDLRVLVRIEIVGGELEEVGRRGRSTRMPLRFRQ